MVGQMTCCEHTGYKPRYNFICDLCFPKNKQSKSSTPPHHSDELQDIKIKPIEVEILDARIDELSRAYPNMQKHQGASGEGNYYYEDRLAELTQQRAALTGQKEK